MFTSSTDEQYQFQCPRCLVDISVDVPRGASPTAVLGEYAQKRQVTTGNITITYPYQPSSGTSPIVWGGGGLSLSHMSEPTPEPMPTTERGTELQAIEGSVIGYRAWRIKDWVLAGTGVNEKWEPGVNKAKCTGGLYYGSKHHAAPAEGCHCGLYGLARFDDKTSWWQQADVLGAIEAWADPDESLNHDRFFVHGTGFRAQYAKIVLLATSEDYPRAKNAAIRSLAAEYGADTCHRAHLEDAAKEHGQLVSDEMLAWAKEGEPDDLTVTLNLNMSQYAKSITQSINQMIASMSTSTWGTYTPGPKQKSPRRDKGICQTLGYPGSPKHGKYRKGNRVRDRNGDIYRCTHSGNPGSWELEA